MNLLDTASLVVTPNGYKASKLYSIIPSDGTGDMTFARTGDTATRVNSSGLIETVLANKPRLDYLGSTCPKLLLEPQRTNVITNSEQINLWSGTATINSNVAISPTGVQNADEVIFNNGYIIFNTPITSGTSYTASIFYKNNNYTNSDYFDFYVSDGVIGPMIVRVYPSTNTYTNVQGWVGASASIESYGNGWYRVILKATANQTGTGWFEIDSASNKSVYLWGAQLETGAYATSYIPTTTASVTRNADSCITGSVTSLVGQTEGTIFVEISRKSIFENFFLILSSIAGTTSNSYQNSIYFLQQSNGALLIEGFVSNVKVFGFSAGILSLTSHKIAIGYKLNDFVLYIDGVQIATDTSGTVPAMNYFTLAGGADGGANSSNIKSAALWKTRLQNAELATLTSI